MYAIESEDKVLFLLQKRKKTKEIQKAGKQNKFKITFLLNKSPASMQYKNKN